MSGRRFNTSCKPCRKSRIGCDSVLQKGNPCTNCVRRSKICEVPENDQRTPNLRHDSHRETNASSGHVGYGGRTTGMASFPRDARCLGSPSLLASPTLPSFDFEAIARRRTQAVALHDLLFETFIAVFESRSTMWFGDSCCPYLELTVGEKSLVSRTVVELDRFGTESDSVTGRRPRHRSDSFTISNQGSDIEATLNNALRHAIYAYAFNWLPFRSAFQQAHGVNGVEAQRMEQEIRTHLWRLTRNSMFAAMSRPSYRSVLALLLFSYTEMPVDNEDYGFNHLCNEVLFSHLNYLRFTLQHRPAIRPLCEYTTTIPLTQAALESSVPTRRSKASEKHEHMRDSMLWLGVICDSTRSVLQQRPSVIFPGRSGEGSVWNLIRQRTVIFEQSFRSLNGSPLPLPRDVTVVVLQHASACKTMRLGMMSQYFDAVFHHNEVEVHEVEDAAQRVLVETRRFHGVFDQLLAMCARDYLTMTAESQLNYVLLLTHYHLGSLVLADVLDDLDVVPESLRDAALSRLYACNAVVNALTLALNYDRYSDNDSPHGSSLLRDPTPIVMVEVLARTGKSIFLLYDAAKIALPTTQIMISVVVTALMVLSHVSVTATYVLTSFRQTCAKNNLKITSDSHSVPTPISPEKLSVLSSCNTSFIDEFLREMQIQAGTDRSLLNRSIAKHEKLPDSPSYQPQELRPGDAHSDSCWTDPDHVSPPSIHDSERPNALRTPSSLNFDPALSLSDE